MPFRATRCICVHTGYLVVLVTLTKCVCVCVCVCLCVCVCVCLTRSKRCWFIVRVPGEEVQWAGTGTNPP